MNRAQAIVQHLLASRIANLPSAKESSYSFASSNIALCKYWGKRDRILNLPITSSLSVSLAQHGTHTKLKLSTANQDRVIHNQEQLDPQSGFVTKLVTFLDLFRPQKNWTLDLDIHTTIPLAAGLASSASGFASLVKGLDQLFHWQLSARELSILARMGSGSASRSIENGFVEWHAGQSEDGMDSYAEVLPCRWPELCIGLLVVSDKPKLISSRDAMQSTIETSLFYQLWPEKVRKDLSALKIAIQRQDFQLLGATAESNALAMHATMLNSWPPISYNLPETMQSMHKIWSLRQQGLPLYFTQDAGPNLKLLFLKKDVINIKNYFPSLELVCPFN